MNKQPEKLEYYFSLFLRNRRGLFLSGILFFGLFLAWAFSVPPESKEGSLGIIMPIFGFASSVFVFFAVMGVREIEKPDEKTFWYTYLSILTGVMIFLIPSFLVLMSVENISREIPFLLLGILSAVAFQIPVALKYRKFLYFFKGEGHIPNPLTTAFNLALAPGALVFGLIMAIRGFGPEYIGWISLGYFPSLLICITVYLLSLFLSHHWALKVISKEHNQKVIQNG